MTVGERIKMLRKAKEMSQKQLAEKMLVSRQTISLWEKNETAPTIDNLIRLKDVFGVSVDGILGEKNSDNSDDNCLEILKFRYSSKEFSEIVKMATRGSLYRAIVAIVLLLLLIILVIITKTDEAIKGVATFTSACLLFACIKFLIDFYRTKRKLEVKIPTNTFEYKIYKDHMNLNIIKNNEVHLSKRISYESIFGVKDLGEYIVFSYEGQWFIIRKSQLSDTSILNRIFLFSQVGSSDNSGTKHKIVSILFVIISIVSFFVGLVLCIINALSNSEFNDNMWMMLLFLPVPISSFVYGLFLKAKGYKYKKNIVVGLIVSFLIIMCSTSVISVG